MWAAVKGAETRAAWQSPGWVADIDGVTATIRRPPAAPWVVPLTCAHPEVTVIGLSEDRRTLTLSAVLGPVDGIAGEFGDAWLKTAGGDVVEVRIHDVDDDEAQLAAELRTLSVISAAAPATLQWATYLGDLAADGPVENEGRFEVEIAWDALAPGGGDAIGRRMAGVLEVRPRRFDTNLTVPLVLKRVPGLEGRIERRGSVQPLIDNGYEQLQIWLERDLGTCDIGAVVWGRLQPAHLYVVRSYLAANLTDEAALLKLGENAFRDATARLRTDCNADGQVEVEALRVGRDFAYGGFPSAKDWTP